MDAIATRMHQIRPERKSTVVLWKLQLEIPCADAVY